MVGQSKHAIGLYFSVAGSSGSADQVDNNLSIATATSTEPMQPSIAA